MLLIIFIFKFTSYILYIAGNIVEVFKLPIQLNIFTSQVIQTNYHLNLFDDYNFYHKKTPAKVTKCGGYMNMTHDTLI